MFKYAFIEEVGGATPENYSFTYENKESSSIVAGVDSMEIAEELVDVYKRQDLLLILFLK